MIRLAWIELPNAARDGAGVELSVAEGDASWIQTATIPGLSPEWRTWTNTPARCRPPTTARSSRAPTITLSDHLPRPLLVFGGLGGKDRSAGLCGRADGRGPGRHTRPAGTRAETG
jgi:hypothetical protein